MLGRRSSSFLLLAASLIFAAAYAPARAAPGACDLNPTSLSDEEQEGCDALRDVKGYFAAFGLPVELDVTIRFLPSVVIEIASATGVADELPVIGRFHRHKREIQMLSVDAATQSNRRPWKLAWTHEIARSILRHEVAHAAIARLLGERADKLPPAWHEALAYAVQIDMMDEALRSKVLANYPDAARFDRTTKINDFTYGFDPDGFAIRAWLTYVRGGRAEFLKKALAFEHDMIDLREYFY
ncbi:MAG: DUF6639 family protein [Beijerinckiaceae bacterium]